MHERSGLPPIHVRLPPVVVAYYSFRSFKVPVYQFVLSRSFAYSLVVYVICHRFFFITLIVGGSVVRVEETTSTRGLWDTGAKGRSPPPTGLPT